MKRLQKVLIGIFSSLFLMCFFTYKALANIPEETPTPIVYPESGLSDNLFVSQNSKYVENEGLQNPYAFPDVPYYIDMPKGDTADVGSGHIVYGNDNLCFFISEIDDEENPHDAVLSQYPPVVYINYSQQSSYSQTVKEDYGYINGLTARYFVDHLLISTGVNTSARSAYVIGYCIDLNDDSDWNIIVSVATTLESTESFADCKALLDTIMYTVRYDETLDKKQNDEREKAAREAEKAAEEAAKQAQKESSAEGLDTLSSTTVTTTTVGDVRQIPVEIEHNFNDLSIIVKWSNPSPDTELTFVSTDGTISVPASTKASKQAIINVGACEEFKDYKLNVTHYNECGDVTVKLIENRP